MTRTITLPFNETLDVADDAPAFPLPHVPRGTSAATWRGHAFALTLRGQGFGPLVAPEALDVEGCRELARLCLALDARQRPATAGPSWRMLGGSAFAGDPRHTAPSSPYLAAESLLLPLASVEARSHALVWLPAEQAPSWGNGAGFYPCGVDLNEALDTSREAPGSVGGSHPWTGAPGVWWAHVPLAA